MKTQLFFRRESLNAMPLTLLTHVKVMTEAGHHLAFARITPELLEFIRSLEINIPGNLLNWKGKTECPNKPTTTT